MTLWLNEQDVAACINEQRLIDSIREGFRQLNTNSSEPRRIRVDLSSVYQAPSHAEAMILVPGFLDGIPAYTVKVHSKYPVNPSVGLPSIQGVIQLFDSQTGSLLAILDSPLLTGHRTAAAGAVAADTLARKDAATVAIIGAGYQGEMQFQYLKHIRRIHTVNVFDVRELASVKYADLRRQEGFRCNVATSVEEAVQDADIIVTATWSREPLIFPHMIQPGVHITTLGPDSPRKVEVAEDVIRQSSFVCDDKELARTMGALNTFGPDLACRSFDTLTDGLNGKSPGRRTDDDITVFGGVGLPFQDLVAAWDVYNAAVERGIGQRLV